MASTWAVQSPLATAYSQLRSTRDGLDRTLCDAAQGDSTLGDQVNVSASRIQKGDAIDSMRWQFVERQSSRTTDVAHESDARKAML
jgi:hypothetical protein